MDRKSLLRQRRGAVVANEHDLVATHETPVIVIQELDGEDV